MPQKNYNTLQGPEEGPEESEYACANQFSNLFFYATKELDYFSMIRLVS